MALPAPPHAHSVVLTPTDPPLVITAWDALTQSWVVWSISVSCPDTTAASGSTVFTNPGGAVVAMIARPPEGDVVSSSQEFSWRYVEGAEPISMRRFVEAEDVDVFVVAPEGRAQERYEYEGRDEGELSTE